MQKDSHIERCSKIFVSWQWAISLLGGALVALAGLSWAGGAQLATVKNELAETRSIVTYLQKSINIKLDTLIARTER